MKAPVVLALLSVLLFCSCGRAPDPLAEHSQAREAHGIEYKQGKGLSVPPETGKMLGLKIAGVEEGKTARRIDLALRVLGRESASEHAGWLASGSFPTNHLELLQAGQEVSIELSDGLRASGTLVRIEPRTSRFTGLAEAIVRIDASANLSPGMFLDAHLRIPSADGVVILPESALLKTAEGSFAYVVNGDSIFRAKIELGGEEGGLVEVTNGLYAGDEVVLHPVMPLWLAELQAIRGGKACADGH